MGTSLIGRAPAGLLERLFASLASSDASRPAARPRLVRARPKVCTGHVLYINKIAISNPAVAPDPSSASLFHARFLDEVAKSQLFVPEIRPSSKSGPMPPIYYSFYRDMKKPWRPTRASSASSTPGSWKTLPNVNYSLLVYYPPA